MGIFNQCMMQCVVVLVRCGNERLGGVCAVFAHRSHTNMPANQKGAFVACSAWRACIRPFSPRSPLTSTCMRRETYLTAMDTGVVIGIAVGAAFVVTVVVGLCLVRFLCPTYRRPTAARRKPGPMVIDTSAPPLAAPPQNRPRNQSAESARRVVQVAPKDTGYELSHVELRSQTQAVESLYEKFDQMNKANTNPGTLKYVPITKTRVTLELSANPASPPQLFVKISVAGSERYAQIDVEAALSGTQPLFTSVFEPEAKPGQAAASGYEQWNDSTGAPSSQAASAPQVVAVADTQDVYANAEAIVKSLNISPTELSLGEVIGSGAFGDVLVATWKPRSTNVGIKVAVKRVKVTTTNDEAATQDFIKEISTVAQLTHDNIVHVLGLCTGPPLIVLEFIDGGSLFTWLRGVACAPPLHLSVIMAQQVATGLQYLAERGVVHRDVAARNVLIRFNEAHRFTCKLTDFGLSRVFDRFNPTSVNQTPSLPVRWTSPEV